MSEQETKPVESYSSAPEAEPKTTFPTWIKIGTVAAASAIAGGLAAAWFYRKTLDTLRQAESNRRDSDFGIQENEADDGS
jgi:hypothetical protein